MPALHHGHHRVLDWLAERDRCWFGRRRRWALDLVYMDPPLATLVRASHRDATYSITTAGKEARRALDA